jgi:hypothetical protein
MHDLQDVDVVVCGTALHPDEGMMGIRVTPHDPYQYGFVHMMYRFHGDGAIDLLLQPIRSLDNIKVTTTRTFESFHR